MTSMNAISQAAPRRKGSPWTGLGIVFLKELADHLGPRADRDLGMTAEDQLGERLSGALVSG